MVVGAGATGGTGATGAPAEQPGAGGYTYAMGTPPTTPPAGGAGYPTAYGMPATTGAPTAVGMDFTFGGAAMFTAPAGPDPMLAQMTMAGAMYDGMIGQVTAQIPGMQAQLLDLQIQAATNPEIAAALAPQIQALEEGIDGANGLYDAQSTFIDGMSTVQQSYDTILNAQVSGIKTASDGVSGIASMIGDISVGEGIDSDSGDSLF